MNIQLIACIFKDEVPYAEIPTSISLDLPNDQFTDWFFNTYMIQAQQVIKPKTRPEILEAVRTTDSVIVTFRY